MRSAPRTTGTRTSAWPCRTSSKPRGTTRRGRGRRFPRWPPRSARSRPPPARRASRPSSAALLERADPLTTKYIVKVLGGELRIGLREGLLEAAIAKAFDRPLDEVKWAGMLTGDIGRLAAAARDDTLAATSMALFHPLKFMLASPAEDADEIIRRLGPEVWVEDKYDGIRAQLHKGRHGRPAVLARPPRRVRPVPRDRRRGARPAVGRHPRRRDPRLEGRRGVAVRLAPDAPRSQGAVRGAPGPGPGHLRRLRCARARAGRRRAGRTPAARAARRTARAPRRPRAAPR